MLYIFSFYSAAHHRDLHSFPTRRSSDLNFFAIIWGTHRFWSELEGWLYELGGWLDEHKTVGVFLRSEEHTSELQSLRHLVCRLLLEKKNKFIIILLCSELQSQS